MADVYNALQAVMGLALAYTAFCRLIKTSKAETRTVIRHAFSVMFATALAAAGAPWVWGVQATWVSLLLLSSILLVQSSTAHHWKGGTPEQFKRNPR